MKKLLLILSLVLFSTPSFAEWRELSSSKTATFYLDMDNIKKRSSYVYFWKLVNVTDNDPKWLFRSYRSYNKGDCNDFKSMSLQTEYFSGQMLKGNLVNSQGEDNKWSYPAPRTFSAEILDFVCEYSGN